MLDFLRTIWARACATLRRDRVDDDFRRELSAHLDLLTEDNRQRGMTVDDARRAARLRLGGAAQLAETNHDLQGFPAAETLLKDIGYACRVFRRQPGFTATAVLTLALGVGANTAIFSVINAVFLRPLPFSNAQRIFVVRRSGNRLGGPSLSMPIFLAWQRDGRLFEHLALIGWRPAATLTGAGDPERIPSAAASTELFSVLGIRPAMGREFTRDEGRPGGGNVVILSNRAWRTRFGADPDVLGRALILDGEPWTVVGVLPEGFELPLAGAKDADLWFPIRVPLTSDNPSNGGLLCVGVLRRGVTPQQADASLTPSLEALRARFPDMFSQGERASLEPLRRFITNAAGTAPWLIFGAVLVVLLIACVNVANLLLAASTRRRHELTMRAAMGASRGRLVRQLMTESVVLAALGGALGLAVCYALFGTIVALVPPSTPHVGSFRIDTAVLLFALLLTVVTGVVFGLAPAIGASAADPGATLKTMGPTAAGGHAAMRRVLAGVELALCFVLLVGAALAAQSLWRLTQVAPGFDTADVLTLQVTLPRREYATGTKRQAFFEQALTRFAAVRGIEFASAANALPLGGGPDLLFTIEDAGRPADEYLAANIRVVSPDYFRVLRMRVEHGRPFGARDRDGTVPVAVVNRTAANAFWHGQDPIGSHVWLGKPMGPANAESAPRQVVGIVSDVHESSLADPPEPTVYVPLAQNPSADAMVFALRTTRRPMESVGAVRAALRSIDADLPVEHVRTLEDVVEGSFQDWRFRGWLLAGFAMLAVVIAAIGVYGVIAYSVAQRTPDIAVRLALGAERNDILVMIVRQGMITATLGLAAGLIAALAATRLMTHFLFGVGAHDPLTFVGASLLLAAISACASYVPARRATSVDPIAALRSN